jgi:GNAT superfamily N-acetyltransferase
MQRLFSANCTEEIFDALNYYYVLGHLTNVLNCATFQGASGTNHRVNKNMATAFQEGSRVTIDRSPVDRISVRHINKRDLSEADQIFRVAFGTFIGLPDPGTFMQGRDFVASRWKADPLGGLAAECEGELIGSNFSVNWGSVGFFGPLSIRPDYWERGVGKRLVEATIAVLESRGVRQAGLFTFPHSAKHVGMYQKFGFFPRFLTAVMTRPVEAARCHSRAERYSALSESQRAEALRACRELTESLYDGLDLSGEIRAVHQYRLGDTLLLWDGSKLGGLAVCQFGGGSEGGEDCCYVKFAAARPGQQSGERFEDLLRACSKLAAAERLSIIEAGVSTARDDAYRRMLAYGFRTLILGIAMHRPNQTAYHHAEAYVIDDWR